MHWVMIEMAKLSKDKRERIERLLSQDLCICCECKKPRARGRCQSCLNLIYLPKRFGDMVKAAAAEAAAIRAGTLLALHDRTFKALRRLVRTTKGGRPAIGHDALQDASGPAA